MLIEHIDKIAREKKRDVIYIAFQEDLFSNLENFDIEGFDQGDIDEGEFELVDSELASQVRESLLAWFQENGIAVIPCRPFAGESELESYQGHLYIDLPFDRSNKEYLKFEKYLADKSGTMKPPGVKFFYLTLEEAMKNAHHDEPGYWEEIDL